MELLTTMCDAQIVSVNVGGEMFMATTETLDKSTYFSARVKHLKSFKDSKVKDGVIDLGFIDRDPKQFKKVLELIRDPLYDGILIGASRSFCNELDYYGISYKLYEMDYIGTTSNPETIRELLAAGCEITRSTVYNNINGACNCYGDTDDYLESLKVIVENGATITSDNMMSVIRGNNIEYLKYFNSIGIKYTKNMLYYAIRHNYQTIVKYLMNECKLEE